MTEKIDIPTKITKAVLTEQSKVLNVDLDVFEEMYKAQVAKLTEQGVESYDLSGTMVNREQLAYFSAISAIKTKARSRQNVEGATIIIVGLGGSGKTKDKEQPFRNVYAIADMSIKPEMFLGLKNDGTYVGFQGTVWSSKKITPGEVYTAKISRSGARFSLDLKDKGSMPEGFNMVEVMSNVLPLKMFRVLTWGTKDIKRNDGSGSFNSALMNVLVESADGTKEVVFLSTTLDGWTKTAPDMASVYYGDLVKKGEYVNLYSNPITAVGKTITLDNLEGIPVLQDFSDIDTMIEQPDGDTPGETKIVVLNGFGSSEVTTIDTDSGGIAAFAEISDIMNNVIQMAAFTDIFDSVIDSEGNLPPLIKVLAKIGWRKNKNTEEYDLSANVLSIEPVGTFDSGVKKDSVDDIEEDGGPTGSPNDTSKEAW
jgi:hypothetical protein